MKRDKGFEADISRDAREVYDLTFDPENTEGTFTLRLVCSQHSCKEAVNCVGKFWRSRDEYPHGEPYVVEVLTPLFFYPSIHIFGLPKQLPEPIKSPLFDAFSSFWSNPSGAGNSLRISLEAMMDSQGIKKYERDKNGRRHWRKLHHRVEDFAKKRPDIGNKILALKWLGNSGSHPEGLNHGDLITGFKLMQYAIEELFEKRSRNLEATANKINRRKGPIPPIISQRAARV